MRTRLVLALVALAMLIAPMADAGTCDLTEFPATGTLTAERLNQRIRQTERCLNGNIGNSNWNTAELLDNGNLANPRALYAVSWTISDEDGDATAGGDVAAASVARQWMVPASINTALRMEGISVYARCVGACTPNITVTMSRTGSGATLGATATVTADRTTVLGAASLTVNAGEETYLTVAGSNFTNVKFLDVVAYFRAYHQT